MTTSISPSLGVAEYAASYAAGRRAAQEHVAARENPYPRGTPQFQGWSDGHYDEYSARFVQIDRHSASIWSGPN